MSNESIIRIWRENFYKINKLLKDKLIAFIFLDENKVFHFSKEFCSFMRTNFNLKNFSVDMNFEETKTNDIFYEIEKNEQFLFFLIWKTNF